MRPILALFFILSFLSLPFLLKKEFRLPPVYEHTPPYNPNWEMDAPSGDVLNILQQKFFYFTSGNQSTVFLSEDEKYVLKLFRYTRSRFQILHNIKNVFKKKPKMDLITKINKTLNASHIGCTVAKEFTKAIYAHLNLSHDVLPTTELNFKNKTYQLPMDRYRFVLQRKVLSFKDALLDERHNSEAIERYIYSFATLLEKRSSLNIRNSDPNLGPNFGFLDGEAVELDFGNYHRVEPNKTLRLREYDNLMLRFEEWVCKNMPEHLEMLKSLRLKVRSSYDAES